jgi:hypothetical protein
MISQEKIKHIDLLLENEEALNEYVKNVECQEIKIPENLSKNIIAKIKSTESKEKLRKVYTPKYIALSILKIAACTVFAVLIWQSQFSVGSTYEKIISNKGDSFGVYEKVDNTMKSINQFFMTPVNFKEDKK